MNAVKALLSLPFDLVRAIAEGVALGLETCYPREEPPSVEPETYREGVKWITTDALPPHIDGLLFHSDAFKTLSTDSQATGPAVGSGPAAVASATDAAAGHPNGDWSMEFVDGYPVGWAHQNPATHKRQLAAAAFGLRQWLEGESCDAPTFFGSLVRDLEQFSK